MKKRLKWIVITVGGLYALLGFVVLPLVLQYKLPKLAHEVTNGYLEVEDIDFNPLIGRFDLENISFMNPERQPFAGLKHLTLDVDPMSLLLGKVEIDTILLEQPKISILHRKDGSFNFDWLARSRAETEAVKSDDGDFELPRLVFRSVIIHDGKALFSDLTKEEPYEVALGPINLVMKDIDTAKVAKRSDRINFYVGINDGGALSVKTDLLSLDPIAIKSRISYDSGALYTQWKYLKEKFELEVADGKVKAAFDLNLDLSQLDALRIDNIHAALTKLRVKPKNEHGDVLRVGALSLEGGFVEPLKARARVESLRVNGVRLYVERETDGTIDWEHFVKVSPSGNESEEAPQPDLNSSESVAWDARLENFKMDDIQAVFTDRAVAPNVTTKLDNLALNIKGITTEASKGIDYNLSMVVNETMKCRSLGVVKHTPLNIASSLDCSGMALSWFDPYIHQAAIEALEHYDVTVASGLVGADAYINAVDRNGTVGVIVNDSSVVLDDFLLQRRSNGERLVALKQMRANKIGADSFTQHSEIGSIVLEAPQLYIRRTKAGTINISDVAVPKKAVPKRATKPKSSAKQPDGEWVARIDAFRIADGKTAIKDEAVEGEADFLIDRIDLRLNEISSQPNTTMRYQAGMRINKAGRVGAKGTLQHTPLKQRGSVQLDKFPLKSINPYLQEKSYLYLKDGTFSYKMQERYAASTRKADLATEGELTVSTLSLHDSRDDTKLLGVEKLAVNPLRFEYAPDNLFIEEVSVDGFYVNAVVDANRSFNFASLQKNGIAGDKGDAEQEEKAAGKPFPAKIVKVQIRNSSADFADLSLPLEFMTHIEKLEGSVYNIASSREETSFVEMDGVVDQYGSARIKGSLNAADPKAFTDLGLSFRNLALNNYSPYSAKFVGRKIDDGKLFVELGYKINQSQMKGDNSVVIKKIRLGENVESEDAMSLPLGLAIALLEDSEGVIDIDMPVEGDVDKPDFKYGTVVWKAFSNLIANVATAPFRFLGSLLGIEGDALENIEYEAGKAELLPSEVEKLDALAKAFRKRPRLMLGVAGTYDETRDRHAIQLEKTIALALEKLRGDKSTKQASDLSLDLIEELYEERVGEKKLEQAYDELKKVHKEKEAFKAAYRERVWSELVAAQPVAEQELEALAAKRSEAIASYLTVVKEVEAGRILLKENALSEDGPGEWVNTKLSIEINE